MIRFTSRFNSATTRRLMAFGAASVMAASNASCRQPDCGVA